MSTAVTAVQVIHLRCKVIEFGLYEAKCQSGKGRRGREQVTGINGQGNNLQLATLPSKKWHVYLIAIKFTPDA